MKVGKLRDLGGAPRAALPSVAQWLARTGAATIGAYDGFVVVAPEYNHSASGVLKNAIDYLYAEWKTRQRPSSVTAPWAAPERSSTFAHVRQQLSFSLFTDFQNFSIFNPAALHDDPAGILFAQLETRAGAMKSIRFAAYEAVS